MVSSIILFFYFVLFYVYLHSWIKINVLENMSYTKTVSVIISCRNEDQNILKIISCLKRQHFDKNKLELIFINDHSEDKTLELLEKQQQNCSYIQVVNLNNSIKGKKNAQERESKWLQEILFFVQMQIVKWEEVGYKR